MARCPKVGTRVCLRATAAGAAMYRQDGPRNGDCGFVTTVSLGSGKASCMPGPMGGLVYVDWDRPIRTQGVFRRDLVREANGKALGRARRRR